MKPLAHLSLLGTCTLAIAALPASAEETVVYELNKGILDEGSPWSGDEAQLILSPGEAGQLDFKLADLPKHAFLKVEVDFEIASPFLRMNEDKTEAHDRLQIALAGGRKLFDSSFSTGDQAQSFPDRYGSFLHAPNTGSLDDDDSYRIELLFPHSGDTLELNFRWKKRGAGIDVGAIAIQINGLDLGRGNSNYTISALQVTALDQQPDPLDAKRAADIIDTLSGDDPVAAQKSLNYLIASGENALPYIRERFTPAPNPDMTAKITALTQGLRSDEFKERSAAEAALGDLGAEALPQIKAILADGDALSADVRTGLQVVKTRLEKLEAASPDRALANRVRRALAMLDSDAASSVATLLPPERKIARYEVADDDEGEAKGIEFGNGKLKLDFNLGD